MMYGRCFKPFNLDLRCHGQQPGAPTCTYGRMLPLFTPLFTLRVELIVGSNHYELPELIMALYAFHYMGVPYNKAHSSTGAVGRESAAAGADSRT